MKSILQNNFLNKILDSFIGKVSYSVLLMVFTIICTRLYGIEIFGAFTFAFTLVTILMLVAKAGMDYGLIYFIPQTNYKFVSLALLVNVVISLTLVFILQFFIKELYLLLSLPLIWLYSFEQLVFGIYRSEEKIKEFYLINGVYAMLVRIIAVILLYKFSVSVFSILGAVYFSFIFSFVFYFKYVKSKISKIYFEKKFLKYSFPLMLSSFLGVFVDRVDILMLGVYSSNTSAGVYQVVTQVSSVLLMVLFILNTALAPKISKLYNEGNLDYLKKIYVNSTRVLFLIALIFVSIIIIFNEQILTIFGGGAVAGGLALIIRTIGQFINVSVGAVWSMLAMSGNPNIQMYCNLSVCILNLLLNLYLIPRYDFNGAAISSMISIGLINIIGYLFVKKKFKVKVYKLF